MRKRQNICVQIGMKLDLKLSCFVDVYINIRNSNWK